MLLYFKNNSLFHTLFSNKLQEINYKLLLIHMKHLYDFYCIIK